MERPRRVRELAIAALARDPSQRTRFLDQACAQDFELRRSVESFLAEGEHLSDTEPAAAVDGPATASSSEESIETRSGIPAPVPSSWKHLAIVDKVGQGGFAEVYRARDTKLQREVALKLLRRDRGSHVREDSIIGEARVLAAIKHPNVVTVYGADEHEGRVGLWMEFISGSSLHQLLKQHGAFSAHESALIGIDVCRALAAIHAKGLVHHDVTAQNVMREQGGRIVLMDLGLSVRDGSVPLGGTLRYIAPEIRRGEPASSRSDIYSLGVLLYHLVTGTYPADSSTPNASEEEVSGYGLRDVRPDLPEDFVSVVERALARSPEGRFSSAGSMGKALLLAIESTASRPVERQVQEDPNRNEAHAPRGSRAAWSLAGLVTVVLLVLAVVIMQIWPAQKPGTDSDSPARAVPPANSVAVLLFQNMTGDPSLDWLRTGLAELMITDLGQTPQLQVVSTDSVFKALKEMNQLQEPATSLEIVHRAAERLATRYVLAGSVYKAGSTFRLTVQIHEVDPQRLVGTETVQGVGEENLLSLVDQLSQRVKSALHIEPEQDALLDQELASVTTASLPAFRYYAEALSMQYAGKLLECVPLYERAVQIDPGFALALTKLSVLYSRLGRDRQAARFSELAMAKQERLSARERYYVEGNHHSFRESSYGQALEAYSQAVSLFPNHWPARHNRAGLLLDLERYSEAIADHETNRRERPDILPLYRPLALSYAGLGDFHRGHQVLQELRARRSGESEALVQLGHYLTMWGRTEEALALFRQAGIDPLSRDDVDEYLWAALVLKEDWQGLEEWRKRMESEGDPLRQGPAALYRALVLLHRGRSRTAVRVLEDAARAYPEPGRFTAAAHLLAGHVLLESGNPRPALAHASAARRDGRGDVGEWEGLYLAALCHAALRDVRQAEDAAAELKQRTAALPTRKEERRYRHLVGSLALLEGDAAKGLEELGRAEALLPPKGIQWRYLYVTEHVPIWYSLATAYREAGSTDRAREYLLKIIDSHSERLAWPLYYVRSLYLLGAIHEDGGDEAKARQVFARFLSHWADGDIDRDWVEHARASVGQAFANGRAERRINREELAAGGKT